MDFYEIELNNSYANQDFDVTIDEINNNFHIYLQTINNLLYLTVSVNDVQIGDPFVCYPNQPVIPYPYIAEQIGGNLIFTCEEDNYPYYENFNVTCRLYFYTDP